ARKHDLVPQLLHSPEKIVVSIKNIVSPESIKTGRMQDDFFHVSLFCVNGGPSAQMSRRPARASSVFPVRRPPASRPFPRSKRCCSNQACSSLFPGFRRAKPALLESEGPDRVLHDPASSIPPR